MINMIVAVSRNNQIGVDNQLPWHIKEDLQYFKQTTTSHTIVMGRKTFDSIGRPLPNRKNIVITRDYSFQFPGVEVVHSLEELFSLIDSETKPVFVIGGGEIYKLLLPFTDKLYITLVDLSIDGDTFFPEYKDTFTQVHSKKGLYTEDVGFDYFFTEWHKNS